MRVESAEERTERRKSEQLRQCFSAMETALTVANQEMASAEAVATEAQVQVTGKRWCLLVSTFHAMLGLSV